MMSRGNGEAPRQEPKRARGKNGKTGTGGRKKGGAGGVSAGWQKPTHPALARVDAGMLRGLQQWSKQQTFKHQFRVAASRPPAAAATHAPPTSPPPLLRVAPPPRSPGLAAVMYARQQRASRHAALAETVDRQQQHGKPTRRNSGPSSLGELYALYKAAGRIAEFHSLFPG
jgi:hypothetical protein